jgi:hypothetical protein
MKNFRKWLLFGEAKMSFVIVEANSYKRYLKNNLTLQDCSRNVTFDFSLDGDVGLKGDYRDHKRRIANMKKALSIVEDNLDEGYKLILEDKKKLKSQK